MKIALSTDATDIDGQINPAFGRCRRFLLFDAATGEAEFVENPGYGATGGAGVFAARMLVGRKVETVITGQVGTKARPILDQAGIAIVENATGSLRSALATHAPGPTPAAAPGPGPASAAPRSAAGQCICERCGYQADDAGLPCFQQRCPSCGTLLERRYG